MPRDRRFYAQQMRFLEYVENSTTGCVAKQEDDRIRYIHKRVMTGKENRE